MKVAAVIPSGEGKTTLASNYPDLFYDADETMDWGSGSVERKMLDDMKFDELSEIYRNRQYPQDKVILFSSTKSVPKGYIIMGVYMLSEPTAVRYNIGNRRALIEEVSKRSLTIERFLTFNERNKRIVMIAERWIRTENMTSREDKGMNPDNNTIVMISVLISIIILYPKTITVIVWSVYMLIKEKINKVAKLREEEAIKTKGRK